MNIKEYLLHQDSLNFESENQALEAFTKFATKYVNTHYSNKKKLRIPYYFPKTFNNPECVVLEFERKEVYYAFDKEATIIYDYVGIQ